MGARKGEPHRPMGTGSIKRSIDTRGYVTFQGRVTRDGVQYWAQAVGCRRLPNGKRMSETTAKRLADQNLRALIRDLDKGTVPDKKKQRTTLAGWYEEWAPMKQRSLPEETPSWAAYEVKMRRHILPFLGGVRLVALRPQHILEWRETLLEGPDEHGTRSLGMVRACEMLLRQVLRDAQAAEYAVSDAIGKMRLIAPSKTGEADERPYFTAAQFLKLWRAAAAADPWGTMYAVTFYAGTRVSETFGLAWRHVLWASRQIDVAQQVDRDGDIRAPKAGSRGLVLVPDELLDVLRDYRERIEAKLGRPVAPDELLFTVNGKSIRYQRAHTQLKLHLAAAGLPAEMGWHSFRHGAAQNLAEVDASAVAILQQLRHKDLKTTLKYIHQADEARRRAVRRSAARVGRRKVLEKIGQQIGQ